jgi:hypothetical protein
MHRGYFTPKSLNFSHFNVSTTLGTNIILLTQRLEHFHAKETNKMLNKLIYCNKLLPVL